MSILFCYRPSKAHVSATSLPNLGVEVWSTQPPWSEVFVAVGAALGKASISPRHSGRIHVSNDQNYGRFGTVFRVTNVRTKPKAKYVDGSEAVTFFKDFFTDADITVYGQDLPVEQEASDL
ncbi:hypothetical protein N0V85_003017 [Neurospora sp. IMI 360204]|nr:hypothetical protein N0V85_003017 [Neurospora sp. IMI 360204]